MSLSVLRRQTGPDAAQRGDEKRPMNDRCQIETGKRTAPSGSAGGQTPSNQGRETPGGPQRTEKRQRRERDEESERDDHMRRCGRRSQNSGRNKTKTFSTSRRPTS